MIGAETKDMYRSDMRAAKTLSLAECKRLMTSEIDSATKEQIVLSLLSIIFSYALKLQDDKGTDIMDLTAVGNLCVVEHLEQSRTQPNPIAWLLNKTKWAMLNHKLEYTLGPITLPTYRIGEIEKPTFCTLFDAEGVAQKTLVSINAEPLYEAMDKLPHREAQDMIRMLFGIDGIELRSMEEIAGGNSNTKQYNKTRAQKWYYLQVMRVYLVEHYPDFVERYVCSTLEEKAAAKSRRTFYNWLRIPTSIRKKLDAAYEQLTRSQTTVSTYSLRNQSKVSSVYVAAYLHELRQEVMA